MRQPRAANDEFRMVVTRGNKRQIAEKRQFARLKEQFRREQKQRDADLQKAPASDEALRALQGKYQGRLF